MTWVGIDIGGANLKAADGEGWAASLPFPVWRDPAGLAVKLSELIALTPRPGRLAVTMTAELCDCFESKAAGVQHILNAVEQIDRRGDALVYLVDGRLAPTQEVRETPLLAAASNWHALASFAARFVTSRTGLLIDVGSTTTDVIPLAEGRVVAQGQTDTERLLSHELLYRGVGRTPVCAVVSSLPLRGDQCAVAAELFATTADAFVITDEIGEEPQADWTADRRPLTPRFARQRLARQVCADAAELTPGAIEAMAGAVRQALLDQLVECLDVVARRLPEPPRICVVSGAGEFLAREAVVVALEGSHIVALKERVGPGASRCAPAYALALLASAQGSQQPTKDSFSPA